MKIAKNNNARPEINPVIRALKLYLFADKLDKDRKNR